MYIFDKETGECVYTIERNTPMLRKEETMGEKAMIEIRGIIFEDFINYKKPCLTIEMPWCDFKCNEEVSYPVCQNIAMMELPTMNVKMENIIYNYIHNPITHAICFQGLEPFYRKDSKDSYSELLMFIKLLRLEYRCNDDVVIYTGYTENECEEYGFIEPLREFDNIIIKFGRYIPDKESHIDPILGVKLSSPNQYAAEIKAI